MAVPAVETEETHNTSEFIMKPSAIILALALSVSAGSLAAKDAAAAPPTGETARQRP